MTSETKRVAAAREALHEHWCGPWTDANPRHPLKGCEGDTDPKLIRIALRAAEGVPGDE